MQNRERFFQLNLQAKYFRFEKQMPRRLKNPFQNNNLGNIFNPSGKTIYPSGKNS
jgi:hypothetical protein